MSPSRGASGTVTVAAGDAARGTNCTVSAATIGWEQHPHRTQLGGHAESEASLSSVMLHGSGTKRAPIPEKFTESTKATSNKATRRTSLYTTLAGNRPRAAIATVGMRSAATQTQPSVESGTGELL